MSPSHLLGTLALYSYLIMGSSCAVTKANKTPTEPTYDAPIASTVPGAAPLEITEDEYGTAPPMARVSPPESGPTPSWSFPQIHSKTLANGLRVQTISRDSLPLVDIRLVLFSGTASDGSTPGRAKLASTMLKVGGTGMSSSLELLEQIEALGANLNIVTTRDATTFEISVTSDQAARATQLLGSILLQPQWSSKEFLKLKQREIDRIRGLAKSDAAWVANLVLFKTLYSVAKDRHPYAQTDAQPSELKRLTLWQVQQWYKTHATPQNAVLQLTGDISPKKAESLASSAFGKWSGAEPKQPLFVLPKQREGLQLLLVDRPKSSQAEILVAALGPERKSTDWARLKVGNQILGGGVSGRLFLDVRENQSLAYSTYSYVGEFAHGPTPIVLKAGTQTAKAGLALKALIDNVRALTQAPPTAAENKVATQYLADVFLLRMETLSSVGKMATSLSVLDLPPDYYDTYRKELGTVVPADAQAALAAHLHADRGLVVVAGDAKRLRIPLSHFGEVTIIDPANGFKQTAVIPHDPEALLELDRLDGT